MLVVTNTVTNRKEEFEPLLSDRVSLYVCGITPYDFPHLGHGRCYVTFDVLYRLLKFLGNTVVYCRNYTDVDDKLLHKAAQRYGDARKFGQVADEYIAAFKQDIGLLNCLPPTYEPRVTEHVPEIIRFIEQLIAKGHAYITDGNVYFAIDTFPAYGALSGHDTKNLRAGNRVEIGEGKRNPHDFALWKKETPNTFWQSPWGWGRPGWHIECSVLAAHYLGEQIDIHAGGMDLIFPHHENEKAQSEALFELPFVRYWMHNGFVQINKEKMSKSLGNFFTLRDIFTRFDPMVVRFYFLNHHYRAPLEFSFDDVLSVQKSYARLVKILHSDENNDNTLTIPSNSALVEQMLAFICDDLNTVGMMGVLFSNLGLLLENKEERAAVRCFLRELLGLRLVPLESKMTAAGMSEEIKGLIAERDRARQRKDWARADAIRDELLSRGVQVSDTKSD